MDNYQEGKEFLWRTNKRISLRQRSVGKKKTGAHQGKGDPHLERNEKSDLYMLAKKRERIREANIAHLEVGVHEKWRRGFKRKGNSRRKSEVGKFIHR